MNDPTIRSATDMNGPTIRSATAMNDPTIRSATAINDSTHILPRITNYRNCTFIILSRHPVVVHSRDLPKSKSSKLK